MRSEQLDLMKSLHNRYSDMFEDPLIDVGSSTRQYRVHPSQNYNLKNIFIGREIWTVDMKADPDSDFKHIVADAEAIWNFLDIAIAGSVVCTELLEHVKYPEEVIKSCAYILKPGRPFFLSTLFVYPYHKDPEDYWRFTHKALQFMCDPYFSQIECGYEPIMEQKLKFDEFGVSERKGVYFLGIRNDRKVITYE